MMSKMGLGLLIAAAIAAPSFAQTTTFYIAQDVKTKKCTIVDQRPADTTTMTIVGDGTVYKTRTEAEGALKTVKVCTTN